MIDMVRKHTVEGSGNHRTIMSLIDRARAMMKDARATEREFVSIRHTRRVACADDQQKIPPREAWKSVPIGSASDTMYPGYSPKDHQYGKAAEEFGKEWSEARKRGIEFDAGPDGPEYEFGQSKGAKKRRLNLDESGEPGEVNGAQTKSEQAAMDGATQEAASAQLTGDDPLFFFDSNPTPVKGTGHPRHGLFTTDPLPRSDSGASSKKSKKSNDAKDKPDATKETTSNEEPVIEFENIDRAVDAHLKLKQEARKNKKDHKRKRDPESTVVATTPEADDHETTDTPAKKKKTRSKTSKKEGTNHEAASSPEPVDVEMEDGPPEEAEQDVGSGAGSPELKRKKKLRRNGDANGESTKKKAKKVKI